jgi:tRNA pseudouridine38-40 synthase
MIGYAGSGYKGMQINGQEKTIEGDLFSAFVKAGAISKANADDPKKSSLVRCARTDKGVHAAGNVISLKLIVEDPNVIQNINEHLPAQIRVWGIERTTGSFSCYQACDSRWYEYLIPTFSFIPPHPLSYLGQKLEESAEKEGVLEAYKERQEDASSFWKTTEEIYVKPILDKLDPETAASVMASMHSSISGLGSEDTPKNTQTPKAQSKEKGVIEVDAEHSATEGLQKDINDNGDTDFQATLVEDDQAEEDKGQSEFKTGARISNQSPLEIAIKDVKAAYIKAKKGYRISEKRRLRVQEALTSYLGTQNFHNYTVQKAFADPSARRVIRSFNVGPEPVIINDTEWLSLKVHGQSFMMHQIRKMVGMAALVVRCGTPLAIIQDSYGPANISIPKAPGLGLLLERPVFNSYNEKAEKEYNREKIDFNKYQKDMDEFKQREIYDRIFREEERDHQ